MKKPHPKDAGYCMDIRCRSKKGLPVTTEEHSFCQKMFEKYPEWYSNTGSEVFEKTRPAGSFR